MKTTKRIVSMILAMAIVFSFALVSVSAAPVEFEILENKRDFYNFESNAYTSTFTVSDGTMETSSEQAHSGSSSLKFTATTKEYARPYIRFSHDFEDNSTYYLSFWYYSTAWGGATSGSGSEGSSNVTLNAGAAVFSSKTKSQWNKVSMTVTTGTNAKSNAWIRPTFWALGKNNTIYIDDFELVKVSNTSFANNTVPNDLKVVSAVTKNFEVATSNVANVNGFSAKTTGDTITTDAENPHQGDIAAKFQAAEVPATNSEFYINTSTGFDSSLVIAEGKQYYLSYYVYSPNADISVSTALISSNNGVGGTAPQGEWTRIEGIFTADAASATNANKQLFRQFIVGAGTNPVYFDDFVFAEISSTPAETTLETSSVDYEEGIATVTFTSSLELKEIVSVTAPEGIDVGDATLDVDGATLTVDLSGVAFGATCELVVIAVDKYGRTTEIPASFTMPSAGEVDMSITSSSIEDGATDVLSPVDALYFTVGYPIVEDSLTDSVTIEGFGASVTSVDLITDTEVMVSLDGIFPGRTYTVSIDGITNEEGGVLTDTITFTTRAGEPSTFIDFEGEDDTTDTGARPHKDIRLNSGTSWELTKDTVYAGEQALKVTAVDQYGGYAKIELRGCLSSGRTYIVSFYYTGSNWAGTDFSHSDCAECGTPVVTDAGNGWKKVELPIKVDVAYNGFIMSLWRIGKEIYLDNISITEEGAVSNPVLTNGGEYVTDIIAGDTTVDFSVKTGNSAVNVVAYVVQYIEENGHLRMLTTAETSGSVAAKSTVPFSVTLEGGQAIKTKIIILNAETYAPLCKVIEFN